MLPTFSTHGYNNFEIVANLIHMWLFSWIHKVIYLGTTCKCHASNSFPPFLPSTMNWNSLWKNILIGASMRSTFELFKWCNSSQMELEPNSVHKYSNRTYFKTLCLALFPFHKSFYSLECAILFLLPRKFWSFCLPNLLLLGFANLIIL